MKVKFIAEVSSNHNKSLKRSKLFIETAADIGCDGVKFQLFKIDQLFSPEILSKSPSTRRRKEWELPLEFIPELSAYTHELGLEFSCTPFYLEAVNELDPYVDFFKIASYELLWHDLFIKCASTGKPLVFSTGMAALKEIEDAIKAITEFKTKDITILHCTSSYPTPIEDANLQVINTLRSAIKNFSNSFNISIGYSDHTVSEAALLRAIHHFNVNFIEFHLDIDGKGKEYNQGHCWMPKKIENVIKIVKDGITADGRSEIIPAPSELSDRDWRTDPSDGLRPLKKIRSTFIG